MSSYYDADCLYLLMDIRFLQIQTQLDIVEEKQQNKQIYKTLAYFEIEDSNRKVRTEPCYHCFLSSFNNS